MPQPLKDAFLRVNRDPDKLKTMHDKDAARMRGFKIRAGRGGPLRSRADLDCARRSRHREAGARRRLTRWMPGAACCSPGGHGDYFGEARVTQKESRTPERTARLIAEFLDAP